MKTFILCLMLLAGAQTLENCVNGKCPTGHDCAIIECLPESYNPEFCGTKCLRSMDQEPITKRTPLLNCVDFKCPDGYSCAAIECLPENYDPDYCGRKCRSGPTNEVTAEPPAEESLMNCEGEDYACPRGYLCAVIDCIQDNPDRCGNKCLPDPYAENTVEPEVIDDCVNGTCASGKTCIAIDCLAVKYDPAVCGMKCVDVPSEELIPEPEAFENCDDGVCPSGKVCLVIDCLQEYYDPAVCGMKCVDIPTTEPTLENCVDGQCTGGRTCVSIECIPEYYTSARCGKKCVHMET